MFRQSRLATKHPTQPDASLAVEYLRLCQGSEAQSPDIRELFPPKDRNTELMLFTFLVHTAQLLQRSGRTDEARWVLDLGHKYVSLFASKGAYPRMKSSRSRGVIGTRRQPTAHELERGVNVDVDGYVVQHPFARHVRHSYSDT